MQQAKNQLRKQIKARLNLLSDEHKRQASISICEKINLWLAHHPECKTVTTFAHLSTEPDLSPLHQSHPELRWCYPLADKSGSMHFHHITSPEQLIHGYYGLRQPCAQLHPKIDISEIDLFLCPAMGYTTTGERIGKGGGYYDKLLQHRRDDAILLGIAFDAQIVPSVPTEDHDIHVHQVIHA